MATQETLQTILETGILPIIRTDTAEQALRAAEAVHRAGIKVLEVTMTVPGALRVLEKVSDEFGDEMILGAGTVLDAETARSCMLAGAEFFVTPALNRATIDICNRYSKCIMAGALTPTEALQAWEAGADMVKIFPVGMVGGPSYIKALKAPLPQILMIPTGGVNLANAKAFFEAGASAIAVGSELVDRASLDSGDFSKIESTAKAFSDVVAEYRAAA
jgi:2-dehydro-3-deoxyphosphogluconate aldolase/(4S)-4-hydroxy-2-oxoglutarate aldolase